MELLIKGRLIMKQCNKKQSVNCTVLKLYNNAAGECYLLHSILNTCVLTVSTQSIVSLTSWSIADSALYNLTQKHV